MSDDCANSWGSTLLHNEERSRRHTLSGRDNKVDLRRAVQVLCDPFTLACTAPNGSQANQCMLLEATGGNLDLCLFAVGCYVAGDMSYLQRYSTADFGVNNNIASIKRWQACSNKVQLHVVALPYYLPGSVSHATLQELEEKCLDELRERVLLLRLGGVYIKCLFLELVLAGNGAELSERFLNNLSSVLQDLTVTVLVDEVMTGGRTGNLIMTNDPALHQFRRCVSFVTIGKWTGIGLVLQQKSVAAVVPQFSRGQQEDEMQSRGTTTKLDTTVAARALWAWEDAAHCTNKRREAVLKALRVVEKECWGKGVLIFCNKRSDTNQGLKYRYLPMLVDGLKIDVSGCKKSNGLDKIALSSIILTQVGSWLEFSRSISNGASRAVLRHIRAYCCLVGEVEGAGNVFIPVSVNEIVEKLGGQGNDEAEVKSAVTNAKEQGLLMAARKGKKRKRGYVVSADLLSGVNQDKLSTC